MGSILTMHVALLGAFKESGKSKSADFPILIEMKMPKANTSFMRRVWFLSPKVCKEQVMGNKRLKDYPSIILSMPKSETLLFYARGICYQM